MNVSLVKVNSQMVLRSTACKREISTKLFCAKLKTWLLLLLLHRIWFIFIVIGLRVILCILMAINNVQLPQKRAYRLDRGEKEMIMGVGHLLLGSRFMLESLWKCKKKATTASTAKLFSQSRPQLDVRCTFCLQFLVEPTH